LSFYHFEPIEGSVLAPHAIDGVQTPPISLISNGLSRESRAEVDDGTPSIANFEPHRTWKAIRWWLEAMQVIAAV
jgi:hypothetical protein